MTLDYSDPEQVGVEEVSEADELSGNPGSDPDEERLAHSVMEHDDQTVKDGQLLAASAEYSLGSFTPDLLFEQICNSFRSAKRLLGDTIIRELTGFEPDYIDKNKKIREFQEELKSNISSRIEEMKREGLLDEAGEVTEDGWKLASLVLYTEELDHLRASGLGKVADQQKAHYGERDEKHPFVRQRYKDLDMKASIHKAIKRGHRELRREDLVAVDRVEQGSIGIVYAIDASGSMRGEKLRVSKRAGIALSFRACEDGNDAGLIVFTNKIQSSLPPSKDFYTLLHELTITRPGSETDIGNAIEHATGLFPKRMKTKHLVLITDALPTTGKHPGKDTMAAVSAAKDAGITISLVGINLEEEGEKLAKSIVELGQGKLYKVTNLDTVDLIVLEDYEAITKA